MKFYSEGSKKQQGYPCVICGNSNVEVVWDKVAREELGILGSDVVRDEDGHMLHGRIVMCTKCGLIFTDPKMNEEDLKVFYDKQYREIYGQLNMNNQMATEDRHAKMAVSIIAKHIDFEKLKNENGTINFMDVGASTLRTCWNIKALLNNNVNAVGVEPCAEYVEVGRKNIGDLDITSFNGIVEDYNPDIKFDFVTMTNTLEHLHNPVKTLQHIHSLMDDDSIILVSVPNMLVSTPYIAMDGWFSNAHLYHFTPNTLSLLLNTAGFKPIELISNFEEIGEKTYMVAQKSVPEKVVLDKVPDLKIIRQYLLQNDAAFTTRAIICQGGMYKDV